MAKSFLDFYNDSCRNLQRTINQGTAFSVSENRKEHRRTREETDRGLRNVQTTVNQGVARVIDDNRRQHEQTRNETNQGFRNVQTTVNQGVATAIDDNRRQHEETRRRLSLQLGLYWIAVVAIAVVIAIAVYLIAYNAKYKAAENAADNGNGSSFVASKMVPDQVDKKTGNVKSYKEERTVDYPAIQLFTNTYSVPLAAAAGIIAAVIVIPIFAGIASRTSSTHRRR